MEGLIEKPNSTINGIQLFIDSMKSENFLIDTNRLKKVYWSFLAKYPKKIDDGNIIIEVPFPVVAFQNNFSNPKTYFFAKWNIEQQTFQNRSDYLLMTWEIDSLGIRKEKEKIYWTLHEFMGNFPCYIFRNGNSVYALASRLTSDSNNTKKLTLQLRKYINENSPIYSLFGDPII